MSSAGDTDSGEHFVSPVDPAADGPQCSRDQVQQFRKLNSDSEGGVDRSMGIICLMGPATNDVDVLQQMIEAGMTIAMLDCSLDGYQDLYIEIIQKIRIVADRVSANLKLMYPVAIALITKGPRIYTGANPDGEDIHLTTGDCVTLTNDEKFRNKNSKETIFIDHDQFLIVLRTRHRIYLNKGAIRLKVITVEMIRHCVNCAICTGGKLPSVVEITLPDSASVTSSVTERDMQDIEFAVEQKLDAIFLCTVQCASDILEVRKALANRTNLMICVSVENEKGFSNIDEIIQEADGIMITRGYTGVNLSTWNLLLASKIVIAKCKSAGKPAILMARVLNSLREDRREPLLPDVANTVQIVEEGADCLCLECTSTNSQNYVQIIEFLTNTCKEVNRQVNIEELINDISDTLLFFKNVHPLFYLSRTRQDVNEEIDAQIQFGITYGKYRGIINKGDILIVLHDVEDGTANNNTIRFMYASGLNIVDEQHSIS